MLIYENEHFTMLVLGYLTEYTMIGLTQSSHICLLNMINDKLTSLLSIYVVISIFIFIKQYLIENSFTFSFVANIIFLITTR